MTSTTPTAQASSSIKLSDIDETDDKIFNILSDAVKSLVTNRADNPQE